MSEYQNIITLIQISFIFNMIRNGWRFRYLGNNTMEFKKRRINGYNPSISKILGDNLPSFQ